MRWLSRGKVLKRVFDLQDELKTFFNRRKPKFKEFFSDKTKLKKIAFLADIFAMLNELNISLQGPNATCIDLSEKTHAFQLKLQLWQRKIDENKSYMLPNLLAFFEENDAELDSKNRVCSIKQHLQILEEEISRYFPILPDTPFALTRSPFTVKIEEVSENAQEEFIELITSDIAKHDFSTLLFMKFWVKCLKSYPI